MNTLKNFVTWLVLAANLVMLLSLSLHVVRGPGGWAVVPKEHLTLLDTYVDATKWPADEAHRHPALLQSLDIFGQASKLQSPITVIPDGPGTSSVPDDVRSTPDKEAAPPPAARSDPVKTHSQGPASVKETPAPKQPANNIFDQMEQNGHK